MDTINNVAEECIDRFLSLIDVNCSLKLQDIDWLPKMAYVCFMFHGPYIHTHDGLKGFSRMTKMFSRNELKCFSLFLLLKCFAK